MKKIIYFFILLITITCAFAEVETHGYTINGGLGSYRRSAVGLRISVNETIKLINVTSIPSGYGSGGFIIIYDTQYNDLNHSLVNATPISSDGKWFADFSADNFYLYPHRDYYLVQYNNEDWFDYTISTASPLPVDSGRITWNASSGFSDSLQTWSSAPPSPPFNASGYLVANIESIGYELVASCTPNWSCNGHETCVSPMPNANCNSVTDLNTCGETYSGNYSEFTPQTCSYPPPITGYVSLHTSSDIPSVVIDFFVEFWLQIILFIGLIALVLLGMWLMAVL